MIKNSDPNGNNVFILGPEPEGESHIIIHKMSWEHFSPTAKLLGLEGSTGKEVGYETVYNTKDHRTCMVFYNYNTYKPYSKVAVAKYIKDEEGNEVLIDVTEDDLDVIPHIREDFLTADDDVPTIRLKFNPNWEGEKSELISDLGVAFASGTIFKKNYDIANKLFLASSRAGSLVGTRNLARVHAIGLGVKKDPQFAVELYKILADEGDEKSMIALGTTYESDDLGEPDYKEAFKWYKKAADCGNQTGIIKTAFNYYYGRGTQKNYKKAFALFEGLADRGEPTCCYHAGLCYQNGQGVVKDYAKARRYYRLGASADDDLCLSKLGELYEKGLGVKKDLDEAIRLYRLAADKNEPSAIEALKRLENNQNSEESP
ncbi:MAG: sel1 repeat family protein [Oscillospiraceae bacterium]|nr:sel1 repeat family protein [Oscillospiraceae bacterium]